MSRRDRRRLEGRRLAWREKVRGDRRTPLLHHHADLRYPAAMSGKRSVRAGPAVIPLAAQFSPPSRTVEVVVDRAPLRGGTSG